MQNMKTMNTDNLYTLALSIFDKIVSILMITSANKLDTYIKQFINFIINMFNVSMLYSLFINYYYGSDNSIKNELKSDLENTKKYKDNEKDSSIVKYNSKPEVYYFNMYYSEYKDDKNKVTYTLYNDNESNYRYMKYLFEYLTTVPSINETSMIRNSYMPKLEINKVYEITNGLYCKVKELMYTNTNDIARCQIILFSETMQHKDIYNFLFELEYNSKNANKFNNNIYLFEPFIGNNTTKIPMIDTLTGKKNQMQLEAYYQQLPKNIPLYYYKYNTNKSFDNIIGNNSKLIKDKIKFFNENKLWYESKGIPYHMTLLLSGLPGTGKTSAIKAIANYTQRHIINVSFNHIKTAEQLINLLTNEHLTISDTKKSDDIKQIYIPISKRLYVLEEIDTFGDIVKDRSLKNKDDGCNEEISSDVISEYQITLGHLLTLLDGTVEYPGRMIVITCNHPELLDKALIRGGRMDLHIHYTYCTIDEIIEYIQFVKDCILDEFLITKLKDNLLNIKLSFADLYKLSNSNNNLNIIIDDIIEYNNTKNGVDNKNKVIEVNKEVEVIEKKAEEVKENKVETKNLVIEENEVETKYFEKKIRSIALKSFRYQTNVTEISDNTTIDTLPEYIRVSPNNIRKYYYLKYEQYELSTLSCEDIYDLNNVEVKTSFLDTIYNNDDNMQCFNNKNFPNTLKTLNKYIELYGVPLQLHGSSNNPNIVSIANAKVLDIINKSKFNFNGNIQPLDS